LNFKRNVKSFDSVARNLHRNLTTHGSSTDVMEFHMQPFSWSEAELQQSKTSDHAKTQRRYSLDNENFDFHSLQDLLGALGARGLLTEGAIYYAADFALVEPDCFENVDEFLQSLEMRHLEKFDPTQVYFTSADDVARAALQRAVAAWINEFIYVEHHWCLVGESQRQVVTRSDIPLVSSQRLF
jgi:hypothetical protein